MRNKGLRISLIVSGSLLFIFKGMLMGSYQWMIIPNLDNNPVLYYQIILLIIPILVIIIGIFGFRGKSKN